VPRKFGAGATVPTGISRIARSDGSAGRVDVDGSARLAFATGFGPAAETMSDLVSLERAAFQRPPNAAQVLRQALTALATGSLANDRAQSTTALDPTPQVCTRLAAAVVAIVLAPSTGITAEDYARLAPAHTALVNALGASGFGGADHALALMGSPRRSTPDRSTAAELDAYLRYFTLFGPDCEAEIDMAEVLAAPPAIALLTYLKLLAVKPIATLRGHERRDALLALADRLPRARLPATADHLVLLGNAWMLCSYATHPDKHRMKGLLHPVMREATQRLGAADARLPAAREPRERPTVVVAAEIMHSNHVQYRYFGQYLRQLRRRFRLVLVTDAREIDAHVQALYDEVHGFDREANGGHIARAAELIKAAQPDIVFWLSVGMRHWGVALASLRLAPIQLTALGHSASTFFPTVDYYLTEEGYVGDPALFSETLVLLPDDSLVFERSPHYEARPPTLREEARPLRVALPSNLLKLNPRFITLLARIRAAARPLELHCFPNVSGIELAGARTVLGRSLPGITVHPILPYRRYLELLSACDVNLSPYPFGGLHSVVDSLRQGLAVVAMECPEPHGRTDAMLLRRLEMPEWLIAHDEDEYVAAALRVIDDDATRVALGRQALALDIDRLLFGDGTTPLRNEVVDAMWWIYENHEAIQASGRHVWRQADRQAFAGTA
jgi:hypothetical protein